MGLLNWLTQRFRHRASDTQDSVSFDDRCVRLFGRDGTDGSVKWDELQAVYIETTAGGPFVEDVFYILVGLDVEHVVPQEASGTDELLERLGKLPGFDHDAVCRAMCCTNGSRFVCWQRGNAGVKGAE